MLQIISDHTNRPISRAVLFRLVSKVSQTAIFLATLSATASTVLLTIQPFVLGAAVNSIPRSLTVGLFWILIYITTGFLAGIANSASAYFALKSREDISNDIARAAFLSTLDETIEDVKKTGPDLLHLFNKGKEGCHALIADLLATIVPYCIGLILALSLVSIRINILCGLAMGCIACAFFVLNRSTAKQERRSGRRMYSGSANVTADVGRAHELKELIRCFSAQDFMVGMLEKHLAYNQRRVSRHGNLYFWKQIKLEVLQWLGLFAVIYAFYLGVTDDDAIPRTGGLLTLVLSYFQIIGPITALSRANDRIAQALIAISPIHELLDKAVCTPSVQFPQGHIQQLIIDKVRPQYTGGTFGSPVTEALHAGDVLVITGRSGIGKTTLARTFAGLIAPLTGTISVSIGGNHYPLRNVSKEVLYVPQTDYVFASSLIDNIRLGARNISDSTIHKAIADLHVDTVLRERRLSYRSLIGDRGRNWSGGQRRRIALCRALVRKPSIMILDEPTANLDPSTAANVLAKFRAHMRSGILIIITHDQTHQIATDRVMKIG
ncbi:ATP-binding cassette domain-containing protein [Brucella pituitosa]|uniref:ATP-binding cassette domain-containing protein n=1 Tax=Brucella pituitosa TaxID=571256 RepID=UPI0009A1B8A1|nr:ABC transporter ATP-binding protein [Brucella pituitosa]